MAGPHRWIATTPSSWVAASFDSNLLPASNEIVRFDGTGQGDVIGGLDQTAVDLDELTISPAYFGQIGNHGAPLIISADLVVHRGRGSLFYQNGAGTTDLLFVDSDNLVDAAFLGGSAFSRVVLLKGRTTLLVGLETLTDLEVSYRTNDIGDVILDARNLATAKPIITDFRQDGGTALFNRPLMENMIVTNGVCRMFHRNQTSSPQFTYQTGGTVVWTAASSAGAFTWPTPDYHLVGGTLDISEGAQKTITSLYVYKNGLLYDPNGNLTSSSTVVQMEP